MSLSYQPLEPVLVKDPRVIIDNKRVYSVLRCGRRTTFKKWTTNSISSSNINFSTPPPSAGIIVDRKITLTLPMRVIATFVVNNSAAGTDFPLLNAQSLIAPRAFPIHTLLNTIQLTINNCSVTQNIGEIIHALLRYNTTEELLAMDYAGTPAALDNLTNYENGNGELLDVLAGIKNKAFFGINPRGSFSQFRIVQNPIVIGTGGGNVQTSVQVIIDMVCTEQIMMSPLYWGKDNGSGFTNVTSMDWIFNFMSNPGRAISYKRFLRTGGAANTPNDYAKFVSAQIRFASFTDGLLPEFAFGTTSQPLLNITYITPESVTAIPENMAITYPYFMIDRFSKNNAAKVPVIPEAGKPNKPSASVPLVSDNIQLSSIPRRVYVYVRPSNSDLEKNPNLADCYFSITSMNVQFGNETGIFAEASQYDLYNMSRKNHCSLSFDEWSGIPVTASYNINAGPPSSAVYYSLVGSVVCFEFASDIGLDPTQAPGLGQGSYNLQIRVEFNNSNVSGLTVGGTEIYGWDDVIPCLYVVPVYEGTFTITGKGSAQVQTAVLSYNDILTAQQNPMYNYKDVQEVNGGNFMSGLKSLVPRLKSANKFLKDNKVISRAADVASYIPGAVGDVARDVSSIASKYGYGYDGGVVLGGAKMTKKQLQNRLKNR